MEKQAASGGDPIAADREGEEDFTEKLPLASAPASGVPDGLHSTTFHPGVSFEKSAPWLLSNNLAKLFGVVAKGHAGTLSIVDPFVSVIACSEDGTHRFRQDTCV